MKTLFRIFILLFIFSANYIFSQSWTCGSDIVNSEPKFIGSVNQKYAIVYIDFLDSRLPQTNSLPQTEEELSLVNIDAVFGMGYDLNTEISDPPNNIYHWKKRGQKYCYEDYWKRFFSDENYLGSLHPDWQSHGQYGFPLRSAGQIGNPNDGGDTAKASGSVFDYYNEVSNGNYLITPAVTHPNESEYIYRTGIINTISYPVYGKRYIYPIQLPHTKLHYLPLNAGWEIEADGFEAILDDAITEIYSQINQNDFNLNDFMAQGGYLIVVVPGGTNNLGGITTMGTSNDKFSVVREKLSRNSWTGTQRNVLEGISVTCHEIGHTFGWSHSTYGNLCLMNAGSDNQNCPSYPNMVYRLKAGWIDPNKVKKINTPQDIIDLPPSALNGEYVCGVVTVYGKAGMHNSFNHSEFYVVENRRMLRDSIQYPNVRFDKKFVWRNFPPPFSTPPGFNGGLLVYRYTGGYNSLNFPFNTNMLETNIHIFSPRFTGAEELHGYAADEPDSREFYGVVTSNNPPVFTDILQSRTNSSFALPTGIQIVNVSQTTGFNISSHIDYQLGSPPDYDYVSYGQNSNADPLFLTGRVYMHKPNALMKFSAGTMVDFPNSNLKLINSLSDGTVGGNIIIEGTSNEPVIFQGIGYTSQKLKFQGIYLQDRKTYGSVINQTVIKNCIFKDYQFVNRELLEVVNLLTTTTEDIPVIIENCEVQNGTGNEKIRLVGTQHASVPSFNINSIKNNALNVFISSSGFSQMPTKITGDISIPQSKLLEIQTGSKLSFSEGSELQVSGSLNAVGSQSTPIIFDKVINGFGNWDGIRLESSTTDMQYCNISNSMNGIRITSPGISTNISNCTFTNNAYQDLDLNGFYGDISINIANNNFLGSRLNYNLGIRNGMFASVQYNNFTNSYPLGAFIDNVIDHNFSENNIIGITGTSGILSYASGGFISCNDIQTCANGILLSNSSPYIYNNFIHSNIKGVYLTNGSSPYMAPSFLGPIGLYNAGFNVISDCTEEEIYCENSDLLPISLPILENGSNSIYDVTNSGCLVNININSIVLNAQGNYWGENQHPLIEDFCPQGSIDYSFNLTTIPSPPTSCNPSLLTSSNYNQSQEMILLSSANIDYHNANYNSAIQKYKDYITIVNNPSKSIFPLSRIYYSTARSEGDFNTLENYYIQVAVLFSNDTNFSHRSLNLSTGSDVMQPQFSEAISEYDFVINTSLNPIERHYNYIDKMRTMRIMLDSLLSGMGNGPQGGSSSGIDLEVIENLLENFLSQKTAEIAPENLLKNKLSQVDGKSNERKEMHMINNNNVKINKQELSEMRKGLSLDQIDLNNKSKSEIIQLFDRAISYKIIEFTLTNHTSFKNVPIPTDRIKSTSDNETPRIFNLYQNYPNPFNPISTIKYDIPKQSEVTIKIFDIIGREVSILVNETKEPGFYTVSFDGTNYSSGVYFYRIETGSFTDVKKMVLLK